MRLLLQGGHKIDVWQSLRTACKQGHQEIIHVLLAHAAAVAGQKQLLQTAVRCKHMGILQHLLDAPQAAQLVADFGADAKQGPGLLVVAVRSELVSIVERLLALGVDVNSGQPLA